MAHLDAAAARATSGTTAPLRVVLSARGTFGDIAPFVGVATHLQALGHRPVLAACRSFEPLAREHGIEFTPVAPHQDDICRDLGLTPTELALRSMHPWRGGRFSLEHAIKPYFGRVFSDLWAACEGADLLVAHPTTAPWAGLVAEGRGMPWQTLALQCLPLLVKSVKEPPVLPAFPLRTLVRVLGPRLSRALLQRSAAAARGGYAFLDDQARALGLFDANRHPVLDRAFSPHGVMAMVPPSFMGARVPDDLGLPPLQFLGFSWFDPTAGQTLPAPLLAFLNEGPAPLLITLGTSVICQAPGMYAQWSRQCAQLGLRAVFIGEAASLGPRVPRTQMALPWASLPALMPHCAGVVNAGGMGVCAQAMAAGLPQLIVPFAFDQPDNAMRIARMGAAQVLRPNRAHGTAMADALRHLSQDEALHARARALVPLLNPVCGTLMAARIIDEQYASKHAYLAHEPSARRSG